MPSCIVNPSPKPDAAIRLFCFPYAGGGASIFFPWTRLPELSKFDVCTIQYPGRETRLKESPHISLPTLINDLIQNTQFFSEKPCVFFGHSMGGLVAFELCRALRKKNITPVHLFVSGAEPPQISQIDEKLHLLPDKQFIEEIGRRYSGVAKNLTQYPELLEMALPILKADFQLLEAYEYQKEDPLSMPITVLGGNKDEIVTPSILEGWREQTTDTCTIKIFDGDHFFLNSARPAIIQTLLQQLSVKN